jgi:hypothetical protein
VKLFMWIAIIAIVSAFGMIAAGYFTRRDFEIGTCVTCGANIERDRKYLLGLNWISKVAVAPSQTTRMLEAQHAVGRHVHAMDSFGTISGAGNVRIWLPTNEPHVLLMLEAMYAFGDRATADVWRKRLLENPTKRQAYEALTDDFDALPAVPFEDASAFNTWWRKNGALFEARYLALERKRLRNDRTK